MCHRGGISTGIKRTQAKLLVDTHIDNGDTLEQACDALEAIDPMAYRVYLPCIMLKQAKLYVQNYMKENNASKEEAREMLKKRDPKLHKMYVATGLGALSTNRKLREAKKRVNDGTADDNDKLRVRNAQIGYSKSAVTQRTGCITQVGPEKWVSAL